MLAGYSLGEADLLRRAMGKKITRRDGRAARAASSSGAVEQRHRPRPRRHDLRLPAPSSPTTASTSRTSAPYALITYQTAYMKANYPGRVHGRVDDAGDRQHRQDRRVPPRGDPPRHRGRGAVGQPLRRRVRRRRDGPHPLFARRDQGRRRRRRSSIWSRRAATSRSATSPISAGASIRRSSTSATLESLIAAGALDELEPDRARLTAGVDRILGMAARIQDSAAVGQSRHVRRRRGPPSRCSCPRSSRGCAAEKLQREHDAVGFYLSAHPLDEYARGARRRCACRPGRSSPSRSAAAPPPAASPARSPRGRSGASAPATAWRSSSSPTRPARTRRCCSPRG